MIYLKNIKTQLKSPLICHVKYNQRALQHENLNSRVSFEKARQAVPNYW